MQLLHFDLPSDIVLDSSSLMEIINCGLPSDINLLTLDSTHLKFHSIRSSTSKTYIYRLHVSPFQLPHTRLYRTHIYYNLDIDLFNKTLSLFKGTHDFQGFASQVEQKKKVKKNFTTIRNIYNIDLVDEGGGDYKIIFNLEGALYKMVRNIVGSCLDVGRGKVDFEEVKRILEEGRGRMENESKPAEGRGLCLEEVFWEE